MAETLTRDADRLHRAFARGGDQVRLTVSRETAEWIARLLDARVEGHEVVVAHALEEVTPIRAGRLLGMSRPQVRTLKDERRLDFRKVGTHHRITLASIHAFLEAERRPWAPLLAELAQPHTDAELVE